MGPKRESVAPRLDLVGSGQATAAILDVVVLDIVEQGNDPGSADMPGEVESKIGALFRDRPVFGGWIEVATMISGWGVHLGVFPTSGPWGCRYPRPARVFAVGAAREAADGAQSASTGGESERQRLRSGADLDELVTKHPGHHHERVLALLEGDGSERVAQAERLDRQVAAPRQPRADQAGSPRWPGPLLKRASRYSERALNPREGRAASWAVDLQASSLQLLTPLGAVGQGFVDERGQQVFAEAIAEYSGARYWKSLQLQVRRRMSTA